MNAKQLTRCIQRSDRNFHVVADILHPQGCKIAIKMGGRRVSHRRVKAAMQAAKREWTHTSVFFRDGGTMITPELAADWQQHTAANGYWWPGLAKWAKKAAKTAAKINGEQLAETVLSPELLERGLTEAA